jgi:hypothetical protein
MNAITCLAPIGGDAPHIPNRPLDQGCEDDCAEIQVEIDALIRFRDERAKRIGRVKLNMPRLSGNFRAVLIDLDSLIEGLRDDQKALVQHSDEIGGAP